ncbi:DUF4376 domain-containing protein [Afifella marina]|uniref:DUF4376 domain-containing protein n=1 Tax=Afifella marina DSM 2698 TaxID=1120955 RepID=A0A1G5MHJ9_AFIMA|nr:DUF4376 domain-containing protein [Afifella marina]SCZ23850.1 protein of unknown function [Afifella marina DSM 2698]
MNMIMHALVSPEGEIVDRRLQDPENLPATRPGWRWLVEIREDAAVDPDSEVEVEETVTVEVDRVVRARGKRALTTAELDAYVAEHHRDSLTAGINWQGRQIAIDEKFVSRITGAALKASRDPAHVFRWEVTDKVFVSIDAETAITLADLVVDRMQACFDAKDRAYAAISNGSITNKAQVRAEFGDL